MKTLATTTIGLLVLSAPSVAGGLHRELVPARAAWVAHLDLEGLQATHLWRSLQALNGELDGEIDLSEAFEELAEVKEELGLDPLVDVRSVTVFSLDQEEEPVALITTSAALDAALEALRQEDGYRAVETRGLTLHAWSDGGDGPLAFVRKTSADERQVLISSDLDRLLLAVDVLQGKSASLTSPAADGQPRIGAAPAPGSFLFFAAAEGIPGLDDVEPASLLGSLAHGFVFDAGEARDELALHLTVRASTTEDALSVADILEGFVAMGRVLLSSHRDSPVFGLLRAVKIETRGYDVMVDFRYNVDRLIADLASLSEWDR